MSHKNWILQVYVSFHFSIFFYIFWQAGRENILKKAHNFLRRLKRLKPNSPSAVCPRSSTISWVFLLFVEPVESANEACLTRGWIQFERWRNERGILLLFSCSIYCPIGVAMRKFWALLLSHPPLPPPTVGIWKTKPAEHCICSRQTVLQAPQIQDCWHHL